MNRVKVVEKQIYLDTTKPKADMVEYNLVEMNFNNYATFNTRLLNSVTGEVFENKFIKMEGADYEGWNDDLPYVEDFILSELGLTRLTPEA